jgi:hypothetical protein
VLDKRKLSYDIVILELLQARGFIEIEHRDNRTLSDLSLCTASSGDLPKATDDGVTYMEPE